MNHVRVLTDSNLQDLRLSYRQTLLTVVNELGSVDRTAAGAVAVNRVRACLGAPTDGRDRDVKESQIRPKVVTITLALRRVLQEFATLDTGEENQAVVRGIERDLEGLLA